MPIVMTPAAVREVHNFMRQQELDPSTIHLRVAVRPGGCCGSSYLLDLTDEQRGDDHVFQHDGIRLLCDPASFAELDGVTIDFRDEAAGRGFVFNNPNAKKGNCSCGKPGCC